MSEQQTDISVFELTEEEDAFREVSDPKQRITTTWSYTPVLDKLRADVGGVTFDVTAHGRPLYFGVYVKEADGSYDLMGLIEIKDTFVDGKGTVSAESIVF